MTIVCKIGGAQCANEDTLDAVAKQIRKTAARDRVLLVHGAGPQLDMALRALEGEPRRVDGLRVTSPGGAEVVRKQMDYVGAQLTWELRQRGVPASHIPASDARLAAAQKESPSGKPLGRVGTATQFDATGLPDRGVIVVTPVGWDAEGPLNVNADEGALAVASAVSPDRLVLLTDVAGVLDAQGQVMRLVTPTMARNAIRSGVARGGMIPKLQNAIEAVATGVPEVCIGAVGALVGLGTRVQQAAEVTTP